MHEIIVTVVDGRGGFATTKVYRIEVEESHGVEDLIDYFRFSQANGNPFGIVNFEQLSAPYES